MEVAGEVGCSDCLKPPKETVALAQQYIIEVLDRQLWDKFQISGASIRQLDPETYYVWFCWFLAWSHKDREPEEVIRQRWRTELGKPEASTK